MGENGPQGAHIPLEASVGLMEQAQVPMVACSFQNGDVFSKQESTMLGQG